MSDPHPPTPTSLSREREREEPERGGKGDREIEGERRVPTSSQVIKGTVFKVAWAKDNSALMKHRSTGTKVERS